MSHISIPITVDEFKGADEINKSQQDKKNENIE